MTKFNYETTSAEIVASIENLLIQILLQLPIRSLLRFKSVSKQWLSLITDSQFRRRLNSQLNPAVGLFSAYQPTLRPPRYISFFPHELNKGPTINYSFAVDPSRTLIVDSCNGLYLCASFCKPTRPQWIFYVYNPTTNQSCRLPLLDCKYHNPYNFFLAFDPIKSFHYSVVYLNQVYDSVGRMFSHKILVYSSESGAWRAWKIAADMKPTKVLGEIYFNTGAYWNGSIHWIAELSPTFPDLCYLRFGFDHHVLEDMPPLPEDMPSLPHQSVYLAAFTDEQFYFGQSCDHLHYIKYSHLTIGFNVYELRRDYSEWFYKHRVDLSSVPGILSTEQGTNFYRYSIVCMVRDDHKNGSFLILKIHSTEQVLKYNLDDKSLEHLYGVGSAIRRSNTPVTGGIPYIESLAPLAELL